MEISSVKRHDKTLLIRCQGDHGWGAQGTASVRKICKAADEWIDLHPAVRISRLIVDFSEVHCEWGDAPAQLGIETYKRGIHHTTIKPNQHNRRALQGALTLVGTGVLGFHLSQPGEETEKTE